MSDTGNGNGHGESEWFGHWTPSELERWIAYKRARAHAFVDRNYSVEWTADGGNWFGVFIPERFDRHEPELRAMAKIYSEPSQFGIDGGRVSKLTIQTRHEDLIQRALGKPSLSVITLFNYDRGHDVDRLRPGTLADRLYRDVLDELN